MVLTDKGVYGPLWNTVVITVLGTVGGLLVNAPVSYTHLDVYKRQLQGMGNTLIPMVSGGVELAMRVTIALTFPVMLGLGFLGICLAEVAAWTGAAVLLAAAYYILIHRKCKAAQALKKCAESPEAIS